MKMSKVALLEKLDLIKYYIMKDDIETAEYLMNTLDMKKYKIKNDTTRNTNNGTIR
jgi:hypothetical protein